MFFVLDNFKKQMNINFFIYILLFIFSFQSYILARVYNTNAYKNILLDFIENDLRSSLKHSKKSYHVDPNDRVDVDLWNKLNEEDIKNMPQIVDYSDETLAIRWLKWHTRIALRYHQVYD